MLKPRQAVLTLKEYHPPLGGRTGLRMDFNENTGGCSPRVMEVLRNLDPQLLAKYPERQPVEHIVAEFLGLEDGQVLLTNGVDEGIHLLCQAYVESGDEVLIVVPTFSMYEVYASAAGARVILVRSGPFTSRAAMSGGVPSFAKRRVGLSDFAFPTEAVLVAITPRTKLIAIANPNNPTGAVVDESVLLKIAQAAPQAAVLIDEAYFEFYGRTITPRLAEMPNLFVARTFSKAYGLAGARVGILAGNAEPMRMVRRVSSPYNVNSVALAVLPEALADRDFVTSYVAQTRLSRRRLERELANFGLVFWPSQANFVLCRIGEQRAAFIDAMRRRGVLVRDRNSDPGCEGCVRITLGLSRDTDVLISALRESLAEVGFSQEVAR